MHQDAFEEIKDKILKPPVLHLPGSVRRFQLFSDTSKTTVSSALYKFKIVPTN